MLHAVPIYPYPNSRIHRAFDYSQRRGIMALPNLLQKPHSLKYSAFSITPCGKTGDPYPNLCPARQGNSTLKCTHPGFGISKICATTARARAVYADSGSNSSSSSSTIIAYGLQMSSTSWDVGCTALTIVGAYGLVSGFDLLTKRNILDQKLSRKLVHILSGLLYMMAWPLFSSSADARYIAAIVPLANCVRLLYYGLSFATNEGLVKAVSREGKPEELLRGPLYYVMVLIFCTTVFWRVSPIGVVSLAMMCGGDGIADIIGRRFGGLKLPYNHDKSWAGSIFMFVFGFLISLGVLSYFSAFGFIHLDWEATLQKVAIISLAATIVESLPVTQFLDDNISVPLTSVLVGLWLFPI